MNIAEFFNMGGYALYVWGSYGALALAIAVELYTLRLQRRATQARLLESKLMDEYETKT
jgi:heme exporter protein D